MPRPAGLSGSRRRMIEVTCCVWSVLCQATPAGAASDTRLSFCNHCRTPISAKCGDSRRRGAAFLACADLSSKTAASLSLREAAARPVDCGRWYRKKGRLPWSGKGRGGGLKGA